MKKIIPKLVGTYLNTLAIVAPSRVGKLGFNIFCTPIAPPVKPHHREYLQTANQFSFESRGQRLQAYRWGDGTKKILFLHGWQSHSFRWKKYIEAFPKDEYTLYAFDAPAHGLSAGKYANLPIYSDAILSFVRHIGRADAVVSHSMGSFAMLLSLYENPGLEIGKLVAMGSPGEANDFITFYKKFTGLNDRTFRYIIDHFVQELNQRPDYYSAPRFARSVKVPGLIIHDEADEEAPYAHARRIHEAWPKSKLITTQGFGHNLRAPEVVDMVRDYLVQRQPQSAQVAGI